MSTMKPIVYFAHPNDMKTTKKKEIIIEILKKKYRVLDPFASEKLLLKKHGVKSYYHRPHADLARDIRDRDLTSLKNCDEVFVWIPENVTTIGTIIELFFACEMFHKPTTILCYKPNPFLFGLGTLYLKIEDYIKDKPYDWKYKTNWK